MKTKGFTLLEVLLTLSILVSFALLSMFSLHSFIAKNEEEILINEIKNAVQYAKIQAIQSNQTVVLSPLSADSNWSIGATLTRYNKKTQNKELLYQWQWKHPNWHIAWSGVNLASHITFSNNIHNAISNGQFTLLHLPTQKKRILILNRIGRCRLVLDGMKPNTF